MGGGSMQLLFSQKSQRQNENTKVNPKITFFKAVIQRYQNFALEPIQLSFSYVHLHRTRDSLISCSIPKYAPLVQNVTFQIQIPLLKQTLTVGSDAFECKWRSNIGFHLIKKAELCIGREVIEVITGEWMYLYSQLYASDEEHRAFQKLVQPELGLVYVPLSFWFSRNQKQVLPIQNLTYDNVSIRVTLRAIDECYVIRKRN